jgi:hypothetical protein
MLKIQEMPLTKIQNQRAWRPNRLHDWGYRVKTRDKQLNDMPQEVIAVARDFPHTQDFGVDFVIVGCKNAVVDGRFLLFMRERSGGCVRAHLVLCVRRGQEEVDRSTLKLTGKHF